MKPRLQSTLPITLLIFSITVSTVCYAVEVIRANFEFQGSNHPIDISLFDEIATDTVINYLSYVDDGSYNNLLINRSAPGFVIQAGAYTFDPFTGDGNFSYDGNDQYSGGLQPIISKGEINNEFKHSNIRGTIAMARISGQVNSATSEWFINLTDNASLDTVDEGFTVFGEILGSGMDSLDLISGISIYDLSSEIGLNGPFVSIPLVDYTITSTISDITKSNLVVINGLDRLFNITDIIDFGDAVIGTTIKKNIIIQNYNMAALEIGAIDTSSLTAPFSVISNPCQNITLQLAEQCIVQVEFSPASADFFVDSFDVEILTYGYTFPVTLKTPAPEIVATPAVVDFGLQPVYDPAQGFPEQIVVRINNRGDRTLNIFNITFSTQTPDEFEFIDNCTANSQHPAGTVPPGELCIVIVNFKPSDLFEKFSTISIVSDDPVNTQLDIPVTGGAVADSDGVDDAIESAAPNSGDGNNDELPDRLQDNVASFPNSDATYTTLVTNTGNKFVNVSTIDLSSLSTLPEGVPLEKGAFSFELSNISVGSIAEIGLILPNGNSPSDIYSFGPTADNINPHWYSLVKNEIPGTIYFGNIVLSAPTSGNTINRNISTIYIEDGGAGDSDMIANGVILFTGGPAITNDTSDGSGSLFWIILFIPITIRVFRPKSRLNQSPACRPPMNQ